jgi:MoaA/NifB/PqqE/SkfB family radical SAM enzyme
MEILGRGICQIIQEMPCYLHLLKKYLCYKLFNKHSPIFGSADVINICNLHCDHCYWWLNRKENEELSVQQWKKVIDEKFKKNHVYMVTLVGGEPLLRPEVVELFGREFPRRVCVVTNGTFPIPKIPNVYFFWLSIDGSKNVHDGIRGKGTWDKTRQNLVDYLAKNGKNAKKDIWISMTINSRNYKTIRQVIDEWHLYSNKIGFQFHTPFMKNDPLWLPFGKERDAVIDEIISYKKNGFNDYIANPKKHLEIMKENWGGKGTTPIDCPTWAILSVDHLGREKIPCCIGSSEKKSIKPICEECGLGCYSVLLQHGLKG